MNSHTASASTGFLLVVLLSACADDATGPDSRPPLQVPHSVSAQRQIDAAVHGRVERGTEDEILRLEAAIPGFGGVFLDEQGEVVVYAPASVASNDLRGKLASLAARTRLGDKVRAGFRAGGQVKIRKADYAFSSLIAWKEALTKGLVRIPGVLATNADESINRIRVTIATADAGAAVLRAAAAAQVPTDAIATTVGLQPTAVVSLRQWYRPTGGGIQIVNNLGGRCTLGYNVTLTNPTGPTGFLTASHCASGPIGSGSGGTIYQPQVQHWPSPILGTITSNPQFNYSDPACMGYMCTRADVMYVANHQTAAGAKRVAKTAFVGLNNNGGSISVTGWWSPIYSPADWAPIGEGISKVGRTSGWTKGTLAASCESPLVNNLYVVVCAGRVDNARWGFGDSGAPVFTRTDPNPDWGTTWRQGILFAGSGYLSPDPVEGDYCYSTCSFWYSQWYWIEQHFGTQVWA